MLNRNMTGPMVYEPDHLSIAPGDTVKFLATDKGHNAAVIEGMLLDGAAVFKGNINEEVAVTLTAEGLYGVKCSPHFAMGMAMPIEVGAARAKATDRPEGLPSRAKTRFEEILLRAGRH
ncbi:MAG TPA: pseudoazurin [Kiloniellaceae bacterium]